VIAKGALPDRIHCVGIGGGGLGPLAHMLADAGHTVSGSDGAPGFVPDALAARGIAVARGHDAAHVGRAELLIRSVAVPEDNPEVLAARERDLPVLKYSEALGRLMALRRGVAVAGTHGKTTTTAMVAHLLRGCGRDPAWLVGGAPLTLPAAANWGQGDAMVVEACEYDHSFLNLSYEIGAVTGVVPDHLDCFGDEAGVREAFARFAARVPPGGTLVLGDGVPGDMSLPLTDGARVWHVQDHLHLDALHEDKAGWTGMVEGGAWGRGEFRLPMLGRHNLDNLRVALLCVLALDVPLWFALPHIATFTGVGRRLQDLGETDGSVEGVPAGVRVIDDFAHHPDALRAAAGAARARFPGRRLVAVFQPHQVSRTEDFLPELAAALGAFDETGLCDIFVARDRHPERAGRMVEALAKKVRGEAGGGVHRLGPATQADPAVAARLRPGDVCVIMGAGDIDGLAARLVGAAAGPSTG
jgi:UDP-N-acetylmuramate--alanine ligase